MCRGQVVSGSIFWRHFELRPLERWSTGVGSDIMKPIAAPIIGVMVTSTIHVPIITPVIFYLMKTRALRRGTLRAQECMSEPSHRSERTRRCSDENNREVLRGECHCAGDAGRRFHAAISELAPLDHDYDGVGFTRVSSTRRELLPTTRPPPSPFGSS